MIKIKTFMQFEKEENYLKHMREKGYVLQSKNLCFYKFIKDIPSDVKVKIDYRKFNSLDEFLNYISLFKDSGWKHLYGSRLSGMQYFEQENENCSDDIFSDSESKSKRYIRLLKSYLLTLLICINSLIIFIFYGSGNMSTLFSPKDWYRYPGLWEIKGTSLFWKRFIFETPIAIIHGTGVWIIVVCIIICIISIIKSWYLYKKTNNSKT